MLSEARQDQKLNSHMFPLICGRYIQKINIYTKPNMIIYKTHGCNSGTTLWNSGKERKKRE
jgi:hypothetical protein